MLVIEIILLLIRLLKVDMLLVVMIIVNYLVEVIYSINYQESKENYSLKKIEYR